MNLIVKFNLVLLGTVSVGLAVTGVVGQRLLQDKARSSTLQNARVMMEAAMATRAYTSSHISALLENQMKYSFLPESIPSFAATEAFNAMRTNYPDYSYKEATLNPTNPRDRVVEWESDIVQQFRREALRTEIVGERETPTGPSLYLARPITVNDKSCLQCHSTADAAPKTMVDKYGTANGFGWQLNETVGAQIVSVPSDVHTELTRKTFGVFMSCISAVFALVFVVLTVMLTRLVIRPVLQLAAVAERASMDVDGTPEFEAGGGDEIGALARAFARMRTSLRKAIAMVEA
jgi:methyl-accepting chemotaxis protein